MDATLLPEPPMHLSPDHVVDFDVYHPPHVELGFHEAWAALQASGIPDMVWTPRNGGHWIATRAPLIEQVLGDPSRFSNRIIIVPKADGEHHKMLPTTIDPPEHKPWRMLLNGEFSPRAIRRVEGDIREVAVDLIKKVLCNGRCDFIADFASILPIRIFLRIADLPAEDAPRLKHLTDQITRPDGSMSFQEAVRGFHDYLGAFVDERMGSDREDILSKMINGTVEGRAITRHEALQLCSQVVIAGLDTVVNFLGFMMQWVASHPAECDRLAAHPARIPQAINELLRRFPMVSVGREVKADIAFGGVQLYAGDMVIAPTVLHGIDARSHDHPEIVDFDRRGEHLTFGTGDHKCPGAHLARNELVISLEEWLARVPNLHIAEGAEIRYEGGIVGCLRTLPLVWDAEARAASGSSKTS